MKFNIDRSENARELGQKSGDRAAEIIKKAIAENGQANIILATGTSQFETLQRLLTHDDIDWSNVVMFHLDEYIGLPVTAPASFRKYLQERFIDQVPALKAYYLIDGEADPVRECARLGELIKAYPIDMAQVGIGENGHLAFNDPSSGFLHGRCLHRGRIWTRLAVTSTVQRGLVCHDGRRSEAGHQYVYSADSQIESPSFVLFPMSARRRP